MKKFEEELAELRKRIVTMGELAQTMVDEATMALAERDSSAHRNILEHEERLDQMQLEIDKEAIRLLTVYGPVATDLRFILTASRINQELERIGDQAVNMAEDIELIAEWPETVILPEITKMGEIASGMLRDSLIAFVQEDHRKAVQVLANDDLVDALNDQVVRELLSDKAVRDAIRGPGDLADALALILIARSIERIADQSTNIGEEVVYMVKGDDIRHREPSAPSSD